MDPGPPFSRWDVFGTGMDFHNPDRHARSQPLPEAPDEREFFGDLKLLARGFRQNFAGREP